MKIKAKMKNGVVAVKAMAKHDMMTYDVAEKKTGSRDNANFITHISGTVNGKSVFDMSTSQFLSKNPIFKYSFKGIGAEGDELIMTWVDLKGNTVTSNTTIK